MLLSSLPDEPEQVGRLHGGLAKHGGREGVEGLAAVLAQLEKLPGALAIVWCDVTLGAPLSVAERVLLLDGGRIAYDGDVAGLLTHPRTAEIFGLPAVAQTALMLRERGLWPAEAPISMDVGRVASALRPMLESAR